MPETIKFNIAVVNQWRPLAPFYPVPFVLDHHGNVPKDVKKGVIFMSPLQAVMYFRVDRTKWRDRVLSIWAPKDATYLKSKKILTDMEVKEDTHWTEDRRKSLFRHAIQAQVKQSLLLQNLLKASGKAKLINDDAYDEYWGVGKAGKGKNRLGQLYEELR